MSKRTYRLRDGEPLLDIVSYGRGGAHEGGRRLTPEQVEQVCRTVQRVPEAVVKVLSRDSSSVKAAGRHLEYIGRYGALELEGDGGERLQGRIGQALLEDWDLDIDEHRGQSTLKGTNAGKRPKLVHKLMFSMPPGTPSEKVLAAVRNLAREQFALQHRYALVLHTDEPHPHVHVVLKAVSEQGVRLNIRKATLRHWRAEFAHHLRLVGVPANATDRAVRGAGSKAKKDGIYRASLRGDSTFVREQAQAVAAELLHRSRVIEPGKRKLVATRASVEDGWRSASDVLIRQGQVDLADQVRRFVASMPPPRMDKERIAVELLESTRSRRIASRIP